jgi:methionyl-tRNA formyltransferase
MRFAIATIDRYFGVFDAFIRAGWQPLKLFTVPFKEPLANQQAVIAYAEQNKAAIQLSRMTTQDLEQLRDQGCDALIVASYDWKIPDWQPYLKYAVNFHCSPLPEGRGPYPVTRAILENRASWGVTCHRLSGEIDKGDILAQEIFPLQTDECHEKLDLKIQMAAKKLAGRVAGSFDELWNNATPQTGGSYWDKVKLRERLIDFDKPVDEILRHIRAFGATESLACLNGLYVIVKRAVGWTEKHSYKTGQIAHAFNQTLVITASDGYIALLEHNPAPPEVGEQVAKEI